VSIDGSWADLRSARGLLYQESSSDTTSSLSTLSPALIKATGGSRFASEQASQRLQWRPVDVEVLKLLQEHLSSLDSIVGGQSTAPIDSWTEGQAVCDVLRALVPSLVIRYVLRLTWGKWGQ
jgi:hypothetical protein